MSQDDAIGSCSIKLKTLAPNELERHELVLKLSEYGAKDIKVKRPVLRISTQYFTCPEASNADEFIGSNNLLAEGYEASTEAREAAERAIKSFHEDIGIVSIQGLELTGVQNISGHNLVGEKIFVKISIENNEQLSKLKINKAQPSSVLWL